MKIGVIDFVHECLTTGLAECGHEVFYTPECTRAQLLEHVSEWEGLVVRTKTEIDREVLSHAGKLKFIARAGAGLDNIDTATCDSKGIVYLNAAGANADAVGEQALGMLLSLYANIAKSDREVRSRIWDRTGNTGKELLGNVVGIIGYGNTGKAFARKLSGMGVTALAYDKYLTGYSDSFAKEASMDEIFERADVLSFHVPLTDETFHLGNETWFNRFRKPLCLLNLSRGGVVDLNGLIQSMESNQIWAAGLDVLENERLETMTEEEIKVFENLTTSSRVVLTPHTGGWTVESYQRIGQVLLQQIRDLTACEQGHNLG